MEHYVTLFDSLFLPQGLALYQSMERHVRQYTLWVLCVDNETFTTLNRLCLPNIRLLQLSRLETPELRDAKTSRTIAEYCWTLTPFAPRFVFAADPAISRVTYLDADMWFRKTPDPIFEEFAESKKEVLITEHAYAPEYDQSEIAGEYCVQFITFTRTGGELVRKWWEERCIEWCYSRHENGKFGDQKYLDDWPERFRDAVHVLKQRHLLLAPWNATRFPYSGAIAYHFHGLRVCKRIILSSGYALPDPIVNFVYKLYLSDLKYSISLLASHGIKIRNQGKEPTILDRLISLARGVYQNMWRLKVKRIDDLS